MERAPHSMTVAYVKPSRDAAIAGDYLDFKFKNSYDTPIYIYGEINSSNQLQLLYTAKIQGGRQESGIRKRDSQHDRAWNNI